MARREAKHLKALYTNVGANHDMMQLFDEAVPEPDML